MRGESIRTGYGDLGQVGISFVWPPVIQVRRSRRPESRKYSPAAHFFRHDGIPVVRRVIKHVHYFRVVCYPIGNCEWWTRASDYSVYLFPYPILNRVRFSPWTTNKLSDIA